MTTRHPYYRRRGLAPHGDHTQFDSRGAYLDVSNARVPDYGNEDSVPLAKSLFDARGAACVAAGVALDGPPGAAGPVRIWPAVEWIDPTAPSPGTPPGLPMPGLPQNDGAWFPNQPWGWARDLLELKFYGDPAPTVYLPTTKALAALAYQDYFPELASIGHGLRTMVSAAILAASPGWCGTFGPGVDSATDLLGDPAEGNYDMTLMYLIPMAYRYYDSLSPDAREYLITKLMQRGRIHRARLDDTFTSGGAPNDWDRAGFVSPLSVHVNIGETENHVLMIATARYLTNQLVYQQDGHVDHDNRRNGNDDTASCTEIVLTLLRNILRDDFSEYNAKPYQSESRHAILNLYSFAYDDEVKLAARMVLDYLSARVAVSSNDLRRMMPFRRRNEAPNNDHAGDFMTVPLLNADGADPMSGPYALQAGNTRGYDNDGDDTVRIYESGADLSIETLSDYRLPDSIHDLFVNDLHRRFFQRLHRTPRGDEMGGNRNCDNMEVYAGSPSYLITAGGSSSTWAIDPRVQGVVPGPSAQAKQLGVAVTTSFMPTASGFKQANALIQFAQFAEGPGTATKNYGVAPDFACGHSWHVPPWLQTANNPEGFVFFDLRREFGRLDGPGFFLAMFFDGPFALIEALDTWLHPDAFPSKEAFGADVVNRNPGLQLRNNEPFEYKTWNGNVLQAVIWDLSDSDTNGAEVLSIAYGDIDPTDRAGDAGNIKDRFLNGTVLNSRAEAVVDITNAFLGTTITLDMSDLWNPRRTDESGAIEVAGRGHEVWVDFEWPGPFAGDSCQPFNTIASAAASVADDGSIRVLPGTTADRSSISRSSTSYRLEAPFGGVVIGGRADEPVSPGNYGDVDDPDNVSKADVWVEFDFPASSAGNVAGPINNLPDAMAIVGDHGTIRILPGTTSASATIGNGRPCTLVAPIGGVTIGAMP